MTNWEKWVDFVHETLPSRVVFAHGALQHLNREIDRLGVRRALLLSTPEQTTELAALAGRLGDRVAGRFDQARMHVPVETVEQAMACASQVRADVLVAYGGGSTTGLAKALALRVGLPIVAIPTTYAGSEMTSIWGLTSGAEKRTGRDPRVLPRVVLYDPTLTQHLPVEASITSALNAIAHAAEGLYAHDANPITSLMAREGIAALARALPAIRRDAADLEARGDALYGAWLCGCVLGSVAMGLHHKLCHVLGGSFDLPHAAVHAVMLPHVLDFNAPAAPKAMRAIAEAIDAPTAARGIHDLAVRVSAPVALRDIGMRESDLSRAADLAVALPYANPRSVGPAQRDELLTLLRRAYHGEAPPASAL